MPELPEVETVCLRLRKLLVGQTIKNILVSHPKSFIGDSSKIIGSNIVNVSRKAKLIQLHLSNELNLLVHLKMTGQLIYLDDNVKIGGGHPTADWVNDLPGDHTRVVFTFQSGAKLFFNDMRIFGWIKVLGHEQVQQEFTNYGPDAIDPEFNTHYLFEKLQNRTISIKQAIMINKIVGGIGNIYASEALFEAGIDPRKSSKKLSQQEVEILVKKIKEVINLGIKYGGTTFDGKFVDVDGLAGKFQEKLKVYGREGEKCYNCGSKISKVQLGGRGSYYCSICQK